MLRAHKIERIRLENFTVNGLETSDGAKHAISGHGNFLVTQRIRWNEGHYREVGRILTEVARLTLVADQDVDYKAVYSELVGQQSSVIAIGCTENLPWVSITLPEARCAFHGRRLIVQTYVPGEEFPGKHKRLWKLSTRE